MFSRQGAQDYGDVWPRNSLCCSVGTCGHRAPAPARVCTDSHRPSWNSKACWYAQVSPAEPGRLTAFSLRTTVHPPSPENRPAGQVCSARTKAKSSRVARKRWAGSPLLTLLWGVQSVLQRPPAWASRPQLGLQWKKASPYSKKEKKKHLNKHVPSPPPDTAQESNGGQLNPIQVQRPPWQEEPQLYKAVMLLIHMYIYFILSLTSNGDSKRHTKKAEE